MTHRSKHSESYKPTEADTPLAHASDESFSCDQNQFFAQVPRVFARPLYRVIVHVQMLPYFLIAPYLKTLGHAV
jgi:hypothetical protein